MVRILKQHQENQGRSGKDSIRLTQFFKIHFGPFQKCYSYKRHISDTSPATFPHCDMMYENRNPANWIFLVWRRMGGECAVMKQADRLYHVTSPVGSQPPNKTLHRNTPTISRYSAKLSKEKRCLCGYM